MIFWPVTITRAWPRYLPGGAYPVITGGSGREDTTNAERFVEQHVECVRFACDRQEYLFYDGFSYWFYCQAASSNSQSKPPNRSTPWRLGSMNKKPSAWDRAPPPSSRDRLSATSSPAQGTRALWCAKKDSDADPFLPNSGSGTVDLKTGERLPHDRGPLAH